MQVNGWQLFQHSLFKEQYDKLLSEAERIMSQRLDQYKNHPTVKLLAKITELITSEIPEDPGHEKFNLGNTLGTQYRHWRRAKFGRYRLFFRYIRKQKKDGTEEKLIVYAWVNDANTLRKAGDKNDPYVLFAKGLKRGMPPDSFAALLKESSEFFCATDPD